MKLTTRNLLIILVVLGAAYGVSQLTKRSGRSKSLRSELVSIDTARVSKIEIASTEGEVTLTSSNAGWQVGLEDGSQKLAKQSAVKSLLSLLNTIEPGRLASKTEDRWKDYAVDSAGTRVRVYEDEALSTDIVIGRFGMEGQQSFYTFVRLFEDEEVYVANGFMGMSIGKESAAYRENTLLRLRKDSIRSITFNYPDSAFTLIKEDVWYIGGQAADSASVAGFLTGLGFVSSRSFYDDDLMGAPSHSVLFTFNNQPEIRIEGYAVGSEMVVKSSENALEAFQDATITDKVFKGKNAFLPTNN